MATDDRCCTVVPYFRARPGKLEELKALCEQCVEATSTEPKCLYYGFSFNDDLMHCREGYVDAEGVIAHVANIQPLLGQILEIADQPRPAGAGRAWLARQRERIKVRFWLLSRWYPKGPHSRGRSVRGAGTEPVKPEVRVVEKAP